MSKEDFQAIDDALLELGIALALGAPEVWTLEQRLKYEAATEALVKYKNDSV